MHEFGPLALTLPQRSIPLDLRPDRRATCRGRNVDPAEHGGLTSGPRPAHRAGRRSRHRPRRAQPAVDGCYWTGCPVVVARLSVGPGVGRRRNPDRAWRLGVSTANRHKHATGTPPTPTTAQARPTRPRAEVRDLMRNGGTGSSRASGWSTAAWPCLPGLIGLQGATRVAPTICPCSVLSR
jgi:hypothetical protein